VVRDGVLTMTITGADPFFSRGNLRLQPDQYQTIAIRMKLPPCGPTAQFFWATGDSPGLSDDKHLWASTRCGAVRPCAPSAWTRRSAMRSKAVKSK